MRKLRAVVRIVLISFVTASTLLLLLFGRVALIFSPPKQMSWRRLWFRGWARALAAIMGMNIVVQGKPPQPPFFLVTNHLSYIDILLLATEVEGVFVSRHDVSDWPVIGFLTRAVGTLFINREQAKDVLRVNGLFKAALQKGDGIILFPEGTSTAGAEVKPFKSPLLNVAAEMNSPVSHASLSYRTQTGEAPAHLSVCWWGEMTFGDHVFALLQMPKFYATLTFGNGAVQESDRKALAKKLHRLISEQFIPVVSKPELSAMVK